MIRPAHPDDVPAIYELIRRLAEYERLLDQFALTPERLREHLFGSRPVAEALVADEPEGVIGFALFFHNYSTFLGRPGLYLEDLFVLPEHRGRGHGKALLREVARLAVERGCGRLEWSVLDWNEPSIQFYRALGAVPLNDWTVFRMTGEPLDNLGRSQAPDDSADSTPVLRTS
jgi:GNAT superfamily N-acetyltransferase